MGQGDGSSIKSTKRSKGNLVAYQTRYETAGMGENTGVKFMTDGILLKEIQADLLLRKYSVIVLDECHERNLNCGALFSSLPALYQYVRCSLQCLLAFPQIFCVDSLD